MSSFERAWRLVKRIPRGKVATYGALSRMLGARLTPIGIAWALRAAPEGSVPWHRVVNARGGISTKRDDAKRQRKLLLAEGVRFQRDGCIELAQFGWR